MAFHAAVIFQDLGTGVPPATVGPVPVLAFDETPQSAIASGSLVTMIPGSPIPPIGGSTAAAMPASTGGMI